MPPGEFDVSAFTALGAVLGCFNQAFQLARLQICMHRKNHFRNQDSYPIFNFILRLLADFLGERPIVLTGNSLKEPILLGLFESWRKPNPSDIAELCLAVCDYHTWRSGNLGPGDFIEFTDGIFDRIPIEILLLFKLRQMLGLKNPELDHPLMNTALGVLPPETKFESLAEGDDTLVYRVRQRMMQDGYDEEKIFSTYYQA